MKVLCEQLERIRKERVWLSPCHTRIYYLFLKHERKIDCPHGHLGKEKKLFIKLVEFRQETHHETCKVLKHQSDHGFHYKRSKDGSNEEDMSLDEDLIINMQ